MFLVPRIKLENNLKFEDFKFIISDSPLNFNYINKNNQKSEI